MCLTPTDIAMYCLKNTLHSFSFCCDYIFLKVMRASLGCWQNKCSLTFDRNVLDLSWMCCDASVVCSLWLIAPLIKALSPSDLCQDFPPLLSPYFPLPSPPLSFILASLPPRLPPVFHHLDSCLILLTYSVSPRSLPVCLPFLHMLLSSISPPTLPVVSISGESLPTLRGSSAWCGE